MKEQFHEKAFEKITAEKRERIMKVAIHEFSSKGYNAASINIIARKAEVSIGGMYRYFKSKEALFMTILDWGYEILEEALEKVIHMEGDLFDRIEAMFYISLEYVRQYREINQIYIDVSTESLSSLANRISLKMEGITSKLYHDHIREAQGKGTVRKEVNPGIISFCLDNLIMMVQFSYASEYYTERMKLYAGDDILGHEEKLISGIMDFIKHGLLVDR